MRKALQPYVNQYVLGSGWITDWENMDNGSTRVYVAQPTLRKPNKHILFDNQEIISTEHHLNLFVDKDWLKQMQGWKAEKYKHIAFTGIVKHYTRSNGTHDFGVYPTPQSTLHTRLDLLAGATSAVNDHFSISPETLGWVEHVMPKVLGSLMDQLEEAGDRLPTFNGTYDSYKQEITDWLDLANRMSQVIRSVAGNRGFRRRHKIKKNFLPEYSKVNPEDTLDLVDLLEGMGTTSVAATA